MTVYSYDFIYRFWMNVDVSGGLDACWPWKLQVNAKGYGAVRVKAEGRRTTHLAHRVAYATTRPNFDESLCVLHSCDNPPCCNPSHLWQGTNADNVRDMVAKGRQCRGDRHWSRLYPERLPSRDRQGMHTHPEAAPRGERNGQAKLTEAQVREIRRLAKDGMSVTVIAARYGMSSSHIRDIVKGKKWQSCL